MAMNGAPQTGAVQITFSRRVIVLGVALVLLFSVLAPEASAPLGFAARLAFWGLHIGLGLAAALGAARLLIAAFPDLRDWRLVMLSGLAGVILFAPVAYWLESLFPISAGGPDSGWSEEFAARSVFAAIAVEALEMAPSFLAAWVLINLAPIGEALQSSRGRTKDQSTSASTAAAQRDEQMNSEANGFLARLPPAVGRHVIAVSSDLHYLRVITREGQATVLGALKEVDDAFGEQGLRVHRSHWVRLDAVVRLHKTSKGWRLELPGGHRVPVSRRKRNTVLDSLGADFVRAQAATQSPVDGAGKV